MKLLYKPFAIFAGVIGHRTGRTAFQAVWSHLGGEEEKPPSPRAGRVGLAQVAGSAALEAATIAATAAVFEQLAARVFHHLFGAWPEKPPQSAESSEPTERSGSTEPSGATEPSRSTDHPRSVEPAASAPAAPAQPAAHPPA